MARSQPPVATGSLCRAGVNLFQINSQVVGGEYAAPLLLGISKRSLLEGRASTPAYAAYTGWHADTMFSLVPSKTQVMPHTATSTCCILGRSSMFVQAQHKAAWGMLLHCVLSWNIRC